MKMGGGVWNVDELDIDEETHSGRLHSDDYDAYNAAAAATGGYQVPWLANLLHAIPRFDMALKRVKSTFQPDQQAYKESLLLWSAAPFIWLFATLFIFLIYFCCRSCQREMDKKRRQIPCLRWSTVAFTVLAFSGILCGFYGNEEANKGMDFTIGAVYDIIDKVDIIKFKIPKLNESVTENVAQGVEEMKRVYRSHPELHRELQAQLNSNLNAVLDSSVKMIESIGDIGRHVSHVDVESLSHHVTVIQKYFVTYRRFLTMLFFGLMASICLMLLLGVCNSSKCTLILFCALGIFSLVMCWIFAGVHFGFGLLTGDFCMNPHIILDSTGADQSELDIVIKYYIRCDTIQFSNPFKQSLQSASDHLKNANMSLTKTMNITGKFILREKYEDTSRGLYKEFDYIHGMLIFLTAQVECTNLHKNYIKGLDSICRTTLPGVMLLVLSFAITGLLFTVLVVLASLTWRYFGRNAIQEVDVTYGRGRQGHQRAELMGMQRRTTPPPAYNSSDFYRQYSDVSSSEEARFDYSNRDHNA